jgi:hypothetical protein
MTTYLPPKINTQLIFYMGLVDSNNRPQFKANPTLAAGDVKVTTDDSSPANISTLPSSVSSSRVVKVTVSTGEMNGANIALIFSDQTVPPEWDDVIVPLQTSAHQFDDIAIANVRRNTALAKFPFVMTDSINHLPATGKTVTCTRSIDGGAYGAGALASITEIANGSYTVDFGAGDLNGTCIMLQATASGCDPRFVTIITMG